MEETAALEEDTMVRGWVEGLKGKVGDDGDGQLSRGRRYELDAIGRACSVYHVENDESVSISIHGDPHDIY